MHLRFRLFGLALLSLCASPVLGQNLPLLPVQITEWKAVYGQIESRDRSPARARLGGTLVELVVVEGDRVTAGQVIGRIEDQKLAFEMTALQAQRGAIQAQLDNAHAELTRGKAF